MTKEERDAKFRSAAYNVAENSMLRLIQCVEFIATHGRESQHILDTLNKASVLLSEYSDKYNSPRQDNKQDKKHSNIGDSFYLMKAVHETNLMELGGSVNIAIDKILEANDIISKEINIKISNL